MALADGTAGRSDATAMRDLLRRLERDANAARPARPTALPAMLTAQATAPRTSVGPNWTLAEDPDTGDLIASHTDGTTVVLARKGAS